MKRNPIYSFGFFAAAMLAAPLAHAQGNNNASEPSVPGLTGSKLVFDDEFDKTSWTNAKTKGNAKWYSLPSVPGKYIGYQVHDDASMAIKDGVMVNTLAFKAAADDAGKHCAGPVGMKNDSGDELVSVGILGEVKHKDNRLTWGGAGWVGMQFTTPADGLTVSELGLYNIAGNNEEHEVRIFDAATGDDVAKVKIATKGKPEGWIYAPILGGKKTLAGNHSYCLMCWQYGHHDGWYDGMTTVSGSSGITIAASLWGNWHAGSLFSIDPTGAGFTQQYGFWEARVKMPASGVGTWPSFCLYTAPDRTGSPFNEEVDIFEEYGMAYDAGKDGGFGMRNGNWGDKQNKNGHANVWPPASKPWLNWHVYGFLATPAKCAFYLDGEKEAEFPTPTKNLRAPMYMTLEYNNGGGWPLTGLVANSHMDVDWVRAWSLPQGETSLPGDNTQPAAGNTGNAPVDDKGGVVLPGDHSR